jgi:hypothetical protein
MSKTRKLKDGAYDCSATVHIKGGKAIVELHTTFGLPAGSTIPLTRKEGNIAIELVESQLVEFFNGHAII